VFSVTDRYAYAGVKTLYGKSVDVFSQVDQWANHSIYITHLSWEPVAVYDQDPTSKVVKVTNYSSCKEGVDEAAFNVPSDCHK
jgi:hypothetical protein